MFHKMRRSTQAMSEEQSREALARNTAGVLSLLDENGYTYGVPMSYFLQGDTIYFHCAKMGTKLDAIRHHNKVSFTVIDQDQVIPEEYTTHYRSVIVFGTARIVTDATELDTAIRNLGRRYAPSLSEEALELAVARSSGHVTMIALDIAHISGKESKALQSQK